MYGLIVVIGKLDDASNQHPVSIGTEFSGHAFHGAWLVKVSVALPGHSPLGFTTLRFPSFSNGICADAGRQLQIPPDYP